MRRVWQCAPRSSRPMLRSYTCRERDGVNGIGGDDMALFDLKGRVAVVTGGNGGIGLGMARGLAQAGAAIAIAARNVKKAEAAAAELAKLGAKTAVLAV